jgi:hypothetical protein
MVQSNAHNEDSVSAGSELDRRRTSRFPCEVLAHVEFREQVLQGTCRNLSLGGMLFRGPRVPVGQKVIVSLHLPGCNSVRVQGEVISCNVPAAGSLVAIRFCQLDPSTLDAICVLAKHARGEMAG